MQGQIAGVEPTERREYSVSFRSKSVPQFVQPRRHGRNSVVTDQTVDLAPERPERDQVNRSQGSQKPDPRLIVSGPAKSIFRIPPKHSGDSGSERAVTGD